MFSGNSGSPVMSQFTLANKGPRLLGLAGAADTSLDFGVIEPASRIRETIDIAKTKPVSGVWKPTGPQEPEPTVAPEGEAR